MGSLQVRVSVPLHTRIHRRLQEIDEQVRDHKKGRQHQGDPLQPECRVKMALLSRKPVPGQVKTVSTRMDPPRDSQIAIP